MNLWQLSFSQPWVLICLPLALLPIFFSVRPLLNYSSLSALPSDRLSTYLDVSLRLCGALAIVALLLGLAGLFQPPQTIEYIGKGAHMVVLLDRSSSMDRPFAGDTNSANTTPMGIGGGLNLYAYTHNPLKEVDVRGLRCPNHEQHQPGCEDLHPSPAP